MRDRDLLPRLRALALKRAPSVSNFSTRSTRSFWIEPACVNSVSRSDGESPVKESGTAPAMPNPAARMINDAQRFEIRRLRLRQLRGEIDNRLAQ